MSAPGPGPPPRYELLEEIGRGGAGVVLKARRADGRLVAVKVLTSARAREGDAVARFERERRLLASLGVSEGFVPFLDAGVGARGPYLVMPYLAGGTLRQRLRGGAFPIQEAVELVGRVAWAVGNAHARGIVHRDLKPENVLFSDRGRPLVGDLGLAKVVGQEGGGVGVSLSRDGEFRGTLGYTAPEQLRDAKSTGAAADVFSLGAILYECLAGRPAFVGATEMECIARTQAGKLEPLRRVRPQVPAWLAAVVERALALDPAERYPDGAALADALRAGRARSRVSPRTAAVVASGALLIAALSVAVGWARAGWAPDEGLSGGGDRVGVGVPPVASVASAGNAAGALAADTVPDGGSPAATAPAVGVASLLARAQVALAAGDPAGAISACDAALAIDRGLTRAWSLRGRARREAAQLQAARSDLDQALRLDPDRVEALVERGRIRHEQGDLLGARGDLDRAVELAPGSARAGGRRALLLLEQDQLDEAYQEASRAQRLDLREPVARIARGAVWLRTGRFEAGIAELDAALSLDPRSGLALVYRANGRRQAQDAARERLDLDRAVEYDPALPLAWAQRGLARIRQDDLPGALQDLTRAVELAPGRAAYWTYRGVVLSRLARPAEALEDASRAVALEPNSGAHRRNRGVVHRELGQHREAIEDFTATLGADATDTLAWVYRAHSRLASGDAAGCVADAGEALARAPGDASVWELRASAHLALGHLDLAASDFTRAIELDGTLASAYLGRGVAASRAQRPRDAARDLRTFLELAPDHGQAAEARELLERMEAASPAEGPG